MKKLKIIAILGTTFEIMGSLSIGLIFLVIGCAPSIDNWKNVWFMFFALIGAGIFLIASGYCMINLYKIMKNNQAVH